MSYGFNGFASRPPLVKSRRFSMTDCLHALCVAASFVFVAAAVFLL
jgi:hypothetical protein